MIAQPPSTSPSTASGSTATLSKVTSHCLSSAIVFSTVLPMPGVRASTKKSVIPSSPLPDVRATTTSWSATCASGTKSFVPCST